jgi:hypothetical protein
LSAKIQNIEIAGDFQEGNLFGFAGRRQKCYGTASRENKFTVFYEDIPSLEDLECLPT